MPRAKITKRFELTEEAVNNLEAYAKETKQSQTAVIETACIELPSVRGLAAAREKRQNAASDASSPIIDASDFSEAFKNSASDPNDIENLPGAHGVFPPQFRHHAVGPVAPTPLTDEDKELIDELATAYADRVAGPLDRPRPESGAAPAIGGIPILETDSAPPDTVLLVGPKEINQAAQESVPGPAPYLKISGDAPKSPGKQTPQQAPDWPEEG